MYARKTIMYDEDDPKRLDAIHKIEALEAALAEAKRWVLDDADPREIMRYFSKTKTSSDWIIVLAHMATWYYHTQKKREGK
jgi:hypothetical protein